MEINSNVKSLRLVIADKSALFSDAIQNFLKNNQDVEVIGTFNTVNDFNNFLSKKEIDILLIDIIIFEKDPVLEIKTILKKYPNIRIIVLTILESTLMKNELLSLGVYKYISKWDDASLLLEVISTLK